jgi:hypothetical protein
MLHTDPPSSAEYYTLSAGEEAPAQFGARFRLMSGNLGDFVVMIALPPGPRARGRSPLLEYITWM